MGLPLVSVLLPMVWSLAAATFRRCPGGDRRGGAVAALRALPSGRRSTCHRLSAPVTSSLYGAYPGFASLLRGELPPRTLRLMPWTAHLGLYTFDHRQRFCLGPGTRGRCSAWSCPVLSTLRLIQPVMAVAMNLLLGTACAAARVCWVAGAARHGAIIWRRGR